MININGYDDILIIDRYGTIVYCDLSTKEYNKYNDEDMFGKNLDELYPHISENYPAFVAVREGRAVENFKCEVNTYYGGSRMKKGSVYPVFDGDTPIAAIEYSSFVYSKKHLMEIEGHADVPIYRKNDTKYVLDNIITADKTMESIKKKIAKLAIADTNVLIYGETGTGKELIAQALHNSSRRFMSKFVSVNCGAIPSGIMEGLIFGTTKGCFTGAEDKAGYFEQAAGGTIFLDEINSLEPLLQVKLLKAVETKTIRRLGSDKEKVIDVRIIASTNEPPNELINEGKLRSDLFYRLAVSYIHVPPLRARGNDINVITDYFINYYNNKLGLEIKPLDEKIRKIFNWYSWPGNVRELRNVIEGAFAFADNNVITLNELPTHLVREYNRCNGKRNVEIPFNGMSPADFAESIERLILIEAIKDNNGSYTKAAEVLGISKQLMNYKHKKIEGKR